MKHFIVCLACCLGLSLLSAQSITTDLSFGEGGFVKTSITPYATYGTLMDRTIGNQLIIIGNAPALGGWRSSLTRYSSLGDSLSSLPLPVLATSTLAPTAIKSLSDGGVLVANSSQPNQLFKIMPDNTLDSSFGVNGGAPLLRNNVREIFIDQSAGRILAIGSVLNNYPESPRGAYINAFDLHGRPDSTFGENGRFHFTQGYLDFFYRIVQQPDGKLLVAGFSIYNNARYNSLIRLTQDGSLDTTFGVDGVVSEQFTGDGETYGLVVQPDQKILICGYSYDPYQAVVARYLADGARDETFGDNGVVFLPEVNEATDMMLLPSGKILAYCWLNNLENQSALIQLLPDGAPDPAFGVNGVYFSQFSGFEPPMKMKLVDKNRIVGTGAVQVISNNAISTYLQMQGFLLNLNVGVVTPAANPAMWVYPNPIGASCQVGFTLESAETVALDLFDLQGKQLSALLPPTRFESGEHQAPVWLGESMPPGMYVVRITVQGRPSVAVQVVKR